MNNAKGLQLEAAALKQRKPAPPESANGFRHLKPLLREESRLIFRTDPEGLGAEQFRLLRRTLSQRSPNGGVLLITSPSQGDGKTLTSLNLCTCLASSGEKILLIEADIRRPMVRTVLGCDVQPPPGIENVLEGTTAPSKAVHFIEELSFHVAMVANAPKDPARLLNASTVRPLLTWAREHFQWVVIDAAPVFPAADVPELLAVSDGALLVVRAESTPRELSKRSIDLLGKNLYGVVFNGVTPDSSPYYRSLTKYSSSYDRSASKSREATDAPPRPKRTRSISGSQMALISSSVLVAIALVWGVSYKIGRGERFVNAPRSSVAVSSASEKHSRDISRPVLSESTPERRTEVKGIRHWSSKTSSTVVVELDHGVQYEAHALDNPARMYFDLFDTVLAPGKSNQSIKVNDGFLKRVRIAQPSNNVTRIVLEPKKNAAFLVSLNLNSLQFSIEVHQERTNKNRPLPPPPLRQMSSAVSPRPHPHSPGFLVVLDAGHGGWDLGTVGNGGMVEKDLVLDLIKRLGSLLVDKLGVDVIYTRQDDSYVPVERRAEIANLAKADLFLSVHANHRDALSTRAVETSFTDTYSSLQRTADFVPSLEAVNWKDGGSQAKVADSHRVATDVQEALCAGLSARALKVTNLGVKKAQYVVLTGARMPTVVAEISFATSPNDENKLENSDSRQQVADALYKGIAKFHREVKYTNLASNQEVSP